MGGGIGGGGGGGGANLMAAPLDAAAFALGIHGKTVTSPRIGPVSESQVTHRSLEKGTVGEGGGYFGKEGTSLKREGQSEVSGYVPTKDIPSRSPVGVFHTFRAPSLVL
jgi:hypothetical protein